jgi:hypothetical protein
VVRSDEHGSPNGMRDIMTGTAQSIASSAGSIVGRPGHP